MTDFIDGLPEYQRERAKKLLEKIQPENIRSTLAFAGLCQITHEMIKTEIISKVKGFYGFSDLFRKGTWLYGEDSRNRYHQEVLSLAEKGKVFKASLLWLISNEAITETEAVKLGKFKEHRDQLTHELVNYLFSDEFNLDTELFYDAVSILEKLNLFWTNIEIDTGIFGHPDAVRETGVTSGTLIILKTLLSAYEEGNPNAN